MRASQHLRFSLALIVGLAGIVAVSVAGTATKKSSGERDKSSGEDRREWTLELEDDGKLQMRLTRRWTDGDDRSQSSWSFDTEPSAIEGLPKGWERAEDVPVRLVLRRDPGSYILEGTIDDGFGRGRYSFEPDETFRKGMQRAGMERPDDAELERLSSHDVRLETIEELAEHGYTGLDADDLIRLAVHGASPEFVGEMMRVGYEGLTVEDLVRLRVHDVSPELVREYAALGYEHPQVEDLVRLKVHDVQPAYVRQLGKMKPKPTVEHLVRFRVHDVSPEFVRGLSDLGLRLTPEDIVRFRIHDVTPAFARRALADNPGLSPDDLVRLRLHGKL